MAPYRQFEEYNIDVKEDVKDRYKAIITDLGEDVTREGIVKTPVMTWMQVRFSKELCLKKITGKW